MFRRKTRNSTAYTGVGQASPAAQQPNTNAMAAALTIGENLKQTQPAVYGNNKSTSLRNSLGQARTQGSLLKRSSWIQGSEIKATSTPNTSRTSSYGGATRQHAGAHKASHVEYSVDDSFTDSTLEHMGLDADAHYSNRAKMSDLKLHHTPATAAPVKMVKKYIPTPNGIKVVEVPEATMKQEIARSNSIRSGVSASRSGLITRLPRLSSMNGPRQLSVNRPQRPLSRQASLINSPKIDENVELERLAASDAAVIQQRAEHELLKRQIAEQERLAKELEEQRLEYEKLKELRLKNERRMRELKELEEEEARSRTISPVLELTLATLAGSFPDEKQTTIADSFPEEEPAQSAHEEENVPIETLQIVVDEFDQKKIEEEADVPISNQVPVAVDEIAKKRLQGTDDLPTSDYSLDITSVGSPSQFEVSHISNAPYGNGYAHETDDFGIEEVPNNDFNSPNLAQQLRPVFDPVDDQHDGIPSPRFDPVPEIIDNELAAGRLTPPPLNLAAGSIKSLGSLDSKGSKPIKSAMKMPKATYLSRSSLAEGPAHQAYLSLTTAENTRLNSKLSSSQLNEVNELAAPEQRPSPPKSPGTPLKRMSQSLRKQPSTTATGSMASRSLRPNSLSDASQTLRTNGSGMSSGTFKTQPPPIPPHPALQPNYHSPSKVRAAELYAKAASRPRSQYQPINRLSSFTKHHEHGKPEVNVTAANPHKVNHRTTLRPERPQSYMPHSAHQAKTQAPAATPTYASDDGRGGFKGFKSRYTDSDDEDVSSPRFSSSAGGFRSRFNDSNDDLPGAGRQVTSSTSASHEEVMKTPIMSLRKQKGKNEAPKEEKPKKKKFLRKLFGKS